MTTPFPPGSRLVACIRDSGHEDQELSALHQERSIRAWCEEHGYVLTKIFQDVRSGKFAEKRPGFQAMIAHFRQHDVEEVGVVVWSFSRFARNALEAQFYRSELKRRNIILHSITEPLPSGPEAIILEAAYDFAHQKYLDDLSENIQSGLRDLVEIFLCVPGTPPRGFMRGPDITTGVHRNGVPRVGHRWVPDPDCIPQVRQAFQMRASGASISTIHKTVRLFSTVANYSQFFQNKLFIGILEYGGRTIQNYCEPIIDKSTWDAVQERISRYSGSHHRAPAPLDHPRRRSSKYLLSGLLVCMICESPLCGHTSTSTTGFIYDTYLCTKAKNSRACEARMIPAKAVEDEVLRIIQEHVLQPNILAAMYDEKRLAYQAARAEQQNELPKLERKIRKVTTQINNFTRAIGKAGDSPALIASLKAAEAEKAELDYQLRQMERQVEQMVVPEMSMDQIAAFCQNIRRKLQTGNTETRRNILQVLIKQIAVDRDRVDGQINGFVDIYYPPPPRSPDEFMPIEGAPGGSTFYRHNFKMIFHRRRRKKRPAKGRF